MRIRWDQVGGPDKPVQDTQNVYLGMQTTTWGGGAQAKLPDLPKAVDRKPFVLTGAGTGTR